MSSPFNLFRKNQRIWMAAMVVLAVVAFVILPSASITDQLARTDGSIAVRWKDGTMSRDQVRSLTANYQRSYQFLERLAREVVQLGGRPRVPNFASEGEQMFLGLQQPTSPDVVVQTNLLAEEARRRGVNVDDRTVDLYLQQLTDGKITQKRYQELLRETAGTDLTQHAINSFLKDEICKQLLLQMQSAAVSFTNSPLITPAANWENFQKFEQRTKIEAFPVFTDTFIEKVTQTPTDREMREVYDAGMDFLPNPDSPEFGFVKPYSADIEYLRADMQRFIDAAKQTITADAVQAEYDRRVAAGEFKVADKTGELQPTEPADTEPAKAEETKLDPATTESAPEVSSQPIAESEATSPQASSSDNVPNVDAEMKPLIETEVPTEQPAPADGSQLSATRSGNRLVAFQEDRAVKTETESATPEVATTAEISIDPATTTEAATTEATTESATEVADPQTPPPATSETPAAPAAEVPMRTQTIDEVREQLLEQMAAEPARAAMQIALENATKSMQKYQQAIQYYNDAIRTGFDKPNKPEKLNLAKLADENGLEYGITGFVDANSVQDTDIGRSIIFNRQTFQTISYAESILDPSVPLFTPFDTTFLGGNSQISIFLSWKIESKEQSVPTFEQAREQVLAAWKKIKARELAMARAEEIATALNDAGEWTEVLGETDQALLLNPPSFTWLQPPRASQVMTSIIDQIGPVTNDFMAAVTKTEIGKATQAASVNKDRFFAIKVIERTPDEAELLQKFASNPLNQSSQALAGAQMGMMRASWFENFRDEMKLDMSGLMQ